MAVRQRFRYSTFHERRPVYVWNCRHLAYVGKNIICMTCCQLLCAWDIHTVCYFLPCLPLLFACFLWREA